MKLRNQRVAAVAVGALLLTGTTSVGAVAGSMITSAKIADGTIRSVDVQNQSLRGLDVENGSLGSVDIHDGRVKKADIGRNTVAGSEIKDGSVGLVELTDELKKLLATASADEPGDVSGPAGPQGPQGDTGPRGATGPQGPAGVSGYQVVSGTPTVLTAKVDVATGGGLSSVVPALTVTCPDGKQAIGGGLDTGSYTLPAGLEGSSLVPEGLVAPKLLSRALAAPGDAPDFARLLQAAVLVNASAPTGDHTGWTVKATNLLSLLGLLAPSEADLDEVSVTLTPYAVCASTS